MADSTAESIDSSMSGEERLEQPIVGVWICPCCEKLYGPYLARQRAQLAARVAARQRRLDASVAKLTAVIAAGKSRDARIARSRANAERRAAKIQRREKQTSERPR